MIFKSWVEGGATKGRKVRIGETFRLSVGPAKGCTWVEECTSYVE